MVESDYSECVVVNGEVVDGERVGGVVKSQGASLLVEAGLLVGDILR